MKKLVCLFTAFFFISTSTNLFAQPIIISNRQIQNNDNSIFEDIDAEPLSEDELENVEGEGIISAVAGGIIGGVLGGMYEAGKIFIRGKKETRSNKELGKAIIDSMIGGAVTGFIGGLISGAP